MAGFDKIISFDMGGTSTDGSLQREYERTFETEIAGATKNADDGSHRRSWGGRFCNLMAHVIGGTRVSWGESGTSFVLQGGPLTVTDCNVMVASYSQVSFLRCLTEWRFAVGCRGGPVFAQLVEEIGIIAGTGSSWFLAIAVEKWRDQKNIPSAWL